MIEVHKNDPDTLADKMKCLIPHLFGDHSLCMFHEEKENYEYCTLPNKEPLESPQLKLCLEELMSKYINNIEKISPSASTQANESFNKIVALKCPKSKHYSGSKSLSFCVVQLYAKKMKGTTT